MLRVVRAEVVVQIARTPEDVFAYLTDVSNLPSWQSGVHSASIEGEVRARRAASTSRGTCSVASSGRRSRSRSTTRRASSRCVPIESPVPFSVRHELEPSGGGTTLTVPGEGDAGMLPGFAAGIMARRAEKQFKKDFERLKRLLES